VVEKRRRRDIGSGGDLLDGRRLEALTEKSSCAFS
jgi:hypothetical protein